MSGREVKGEVERERERLGERSLKNKLSSFLFSFRTSSLLEDDAVPRGRRVEVCAVDDKRRRRATGAARGACGDRRGRDDGGHCFVLFLIFILFFREVSRSKRAP